MDPADYSPSSEQYLQSRTRAGCWSWRDIEGQLSAPATHLPPPSQGSEAGHACYLPLAQQAKLAAFQGVSALESRLFSSPSSPAPQRALIKARIEINRFRGSTVVRKGWETWLAICQQFKPRRFPEMTELGNCPQLPGLLPVRGGLARMELQPLSQGITLQENLPQYSSAHNMQGLSPSIKDPAKVCAYL